MSPPSVSVRGGSFSPVGIGVVHVDPRHPRRHGHRDLVGWRRYRSGDDAVLERSRHRRHRQAERTGGIGRHVADTPAIAVRDLHLRENRRTVSRELRLNRQRRARLDPRVSRRHVRARRDRETASAPPHPSPGARVRERGTAPLRARARLRRSGIRRDAAIQPAQWCRCRSRTRAARRRQSSCRQGPADSPPPPRRRRSPDDRRATRRAPRRSARPACRRALWRSGSRHQASAAAASAAAVAASAISATGAPSVHRETSRATPTIDAVTSAPRTIARSATSVRHLARTRSMTRRISL